MITKEWIDALYKDISINQAGRDPLVISAETFFKLAGAAMRSLNAGDDRWIPVSERLPKIVRSGMYEGKMKVLCSYETIENDTYVRETTWNGTGFESDYFYDAPYFESPSSYARIIAWQYMPTPALRKER